MGNDRSDPDFQNLFLGENVLHDRTIAAPSEGEFLTLELALVFVDGLRRPAGLERNRFAFHPTVFNVECFTFAESDVSRKLVVLGLLEVQSDFLGPAEPSAAEPSASTATAARSTWGRSCRRSPSGSCRGRSAARTAGSAWATRASR